MKSQTHKQLKPLIIAALLSCSVYAGTASAQVPTGDYSHIGLQAVQWAKNYAQSAIGKINALTGGALGNITGLQLSDPKAREAAYAQTLADFEANNRCKRISSTSMLTVRSICDARHTIEALRLKKLIEMLKYTDNMNIKIKAAADAAEAASSKGSDSPAEVQAKQQTVTLLQNQLKDGVQQFEGEFKAYQTQIDLLKQQQAEQARVVLEGKPPTTLGSVIQAVSMAGAFELIKSNKGSYSKSGY